MSLVEQNSNTGKKAGIEAEELVEMSGVAEDKTSRRHNRKKAIMIPGDRYVSSSYPNRSLRTWLCPALTFNDCCPSGYWC